MRQAGDAGTGRAEGGVHQRRLTAGALGVLGLLLTLTLGLWLYFGALGAAWMGLSLWTALLNGTLAWPFGVTTLALTGGAALAFWSAAGFWRRRH